MKKRTVSFILALTLLFSLCPGVFASNLSNMDVSDALVEHIKKGEGFSKYTYAAGGAYYIGYGCQVGQWDYPNGVTEEQATALLKEKMGIFAADVNKFISKNGLSLTQGQFDAMCAMSYNFGPSWMQEGNTLPGMIKAGWENYSDEDIVSAFAAWCHVGGKVNEKLLDRRIAEAKMFLSGDYSGYTGDWKWIIATTPSGTVERKINCYKTGNPYGVLPKADCEGYYFLGWRTASGTYITERSTVSENLYVTAVWGTTPPQTPVTPPVQTPSFPDVKAGAWYADYVAELALSGVIRGYEDGYFRPHAQVNWGQALKMCLIASGFSGFKEDSANGHWAQCYLDFARDEGFVAHGQVEDFNASVTRLELAELLAAMLELDTSGELENPFDDAVSPAVLALYKAGIFEGSIEDGKRLFKGSDSIKRSEVAAALCRVLDYAAEHYISFSGYRVAIEHELAANPYLPEDFAWDGDRISYSGEAADAVCGIDVSEHQGLINWSRVAADGVDYAIIRVGYRGYSQGGLNYDKYYKENLSGSIAKGLETGVYFFSQAISVEEAEEEARFLLEAIKGYKIDGPVVFDWEPQLLSGSRTAVYDGDMVTACALAFFRVVEDAGYEPMMYYNKTMAYLKLDLPALQGYPVWYAQYAARYPSLIYDHDIWQYGTAAINGIAGQCDINIRFDKIGG